MLPDLTRIGLLFAASLGDVPMLRWLGNSAFVACRHHLLSLLLAVLAAYALSRYRFHGKGVFGFMLFATQMLPEALLVVPLYAIFRRGLLNNLGGLVLANTAFAMPVAVWILKAAMDGIPAEIEESARVDGCRRTRCCCGSSLPLVMPSVAAAAAIMRSSTAGTSTCSRTRSYRQGEWPRRRGWPRSSVSSSRRSDTVMSPLRWCSPAGVVFFLFVQRRIVSG